MPAATAAVAAVPSDDVPKVSRNKKKLLLIFAAVMTLALVVCAAALWWIKSHRAHTDEEGDDGKAEVVAKVDASHPPVFLPLDPFIVNLADRDADRYAQIGITFELDNGASADQIRSYMPAIRNAILMIIAHKSAKELLDRSGKEELADEIVREAARPMGFESPAVLPIDAKTAGDAHGESASSASAAGSAASGAASHAASKAPRANPNAPKNPIHRVHFSSFIIQ